MDSLCARGNSEIRRQNLDIAAIVTTSPPISSHLIGRRAKSILGCPWIADFRDLWTQNLGERNSQHLQVGLEKRTLKAADALVTVSDPWASRLQEHYPGKRFTPSPMVLTRTIIAPRPRFERVISQSFTQVNCTRVSVILRCYSKLCVTSSRKEALPAGDLRIRFYGVIEPWLPGSGRKIWAEVEWSSLMVPRREQR